MILVSESWMLNPPYCLNFSLPLNSVESKPGLHMIPNRSISLPFMHRWQMKLSYLFKAFSIYLFSLKASGEDFFFCSDSHSNPLLSPALVKIDWQRCRVRGRERRMPEGRLNGRSWFYFPVFEGRTDVYMKQCLQCDWQLSLVWPMSQVPWAC